jgi:hypothetical protein
MTSSCFRLGAALSTLTLVMQFGCTRHPDASGRQGTSVTDTTRRAPVALTPKPVQDSSRLYDATAQAYASYNLPAWVGRPWYDKGFNDRFAYRAEVNPFFQVGHFDGDTLLDIAIAVRDRGNGMAGVVMLHHGDGLATVLGAGTPIGTGGPDFGWHGVWRVEARDPATRGLRGGWNTLSIEMPESGGIVVWWDGEQYQAEGTGD